MFGSGLIKGLGVTVKHLVDTYVDDMQKVPSRYEDSIDLDNGRKIIHQPIDQEGLLTIQYPEERRQLPERFRYIPMLIWDTDKGEDRCTACGICAKVCPPQCIWIVRDADEKGKPVARPKEFFIDATICMSCNFCAEFCPFDAIKMNHDYELAVYDRYPHLVYDKAELTVPVEYYAALWPAHYGAEEEARRKEEEEKRIQAEKRAAARAARAKAKTQKEKADKSTPNAEETEAKQKQQEALAKRAQARTQQQATENTEE